MSTSHEIVVVAPVIRDPDRELYDQCIQVRIEVFVHEQGYDLALEVDEIDPIATHLLLRLVPSGTPVGTIRIFKPDGASYYKLGRLAVLKEYRKHHFGKKLVEAAHRDSAPFTDLCGGVLCKIWLHRRRGRIRRRWSPASANEGETSYNFLMATNTYTFERKNPTIL